MSNSLSLKVTLQAIDKITAPLRGIARQSQRLSQAYKSDMQGYRDTIRKTEQALAGVRETQRKLAQAGKPISRASIEAEQALVKRINETNAALQHRKSLMDQEMAAIRRRQAAMDRGKEQFKSGGMKVASAVGMTYAGAKFMQPAFEFSEAMSEVQALTQLEKDSEMMKKLREQAEHLGATTWATATQAAQAQAYYAMAGYSPEAILAVLPSTLDLAKASKTDLGQTANIISSILSAFHIDPNDTEAVADALTVAFTGAKTDLEKLGQTMEYVAPVANELSLTVEETAAWAGILANSGIGDTKSGTAMRKIYNSLASPNSTALKALDKIDVKTKDAEGNLRNLADVYAEILNKTKKMGNADRTGILSDIVGLEAATAFSIYVDENNLKDFDFMMKKMEEKAGITKKTSDIMSDNLSSDWVGFQSALSSVQIAIGSINENGLREIVQKITKIVQATSNWIKENPKLAGWIFKIGAGLIAATAAIGSLTMAMGIFNMVVLANPIILIIAGIIAAIAALIYFKDEIIGFFKSFAEAPEKYINKAIKFIEGLYDSVINFLGNIPVIGPTLKLAFEIAAIPMKIVWELIKVIIKCFQWIGSKWGTIKGWLVAIWEPIANLIKPIFGWIGKVISSIMNMISYEGSIWDFFKSFIDAPAEYISKAIEWISNLYNKIRDFLTDLPLIGPLFEVMFTVAETHAKLFFLPFKLIWDGLKWIWNNIEKVGQVFAGIWDSIKNAMQPVVDLVKWLYDNIIILIEKFEEFFSFETPEWMKETGSWIGDKWDGVKSFFGGEEEVKVANNNSLLFAGAALTPAVQHANNDNRVNNVTINVEAKTNATAGVIATETINALHSSGLIGDLR